jgi:23S rRNA (cytosine1962-C5)-methyltransferase
MVPAMNEPRPVIRLRPGHDRRVRAGYPWIFSNEVAVEPGHRDIPPGALVRVLAEGGRSVGVAGFNRHALLALRLLDPDPDLPVDAAFLADRVGRALALRRRLFDRPFYRLVHAEADGLPGLVVDRYGDILAVQCNAAWIARLEGALLEALRATVDPRAIILRNDSPARALEGLEPETRLAHGTLDAPVVVEENGVRFLADLAEGQKTGWFFDQRCNRAFAARLARDRRLLDVYAHTGGFGLTATAAGAVAVTLVDRSASALALAEGAARANGVAGRVTTRRADAFADLDAQGAAGERWDVVVVDPPAFVKSKKDLAAGLRGYRKLARLAAAVVAPGGVLLAASCSQAVDPPAFADAVARGLGDAGRQGRILRHAGAGPDHPIHPLLPESAYLKAITLALD